MMSIPFFVALAGFICVLAGQRGAALMLWALSMVSLMVLFRLHATDSLNIVL
ncbi:DUF5993 family protein [Xanthobacteraceae bacterium A53D]